MSTPLFTPDEDRVIGEMLREGHTYAAIGLRIGRSLNSVQSRVFRKGELRALGESRKRKGFHTAPPSSKAIKAKVAALTGSPAKSAMVAEEIRIGSPAKAYDATSRRLTLLERGPTDCCFFTGDDPKHDPAGYCGHPRVLGKPYCEPHLRRLHPKEKAPVA
jgi:hypothetical protein